MLRLSLKNRKQRELIFVKLGGAAITHKDREKAENKKVIEQIAKELSQVYKDKQLLVGHGGGSFPHPVAAKHKVQEGIKACGLQGFAETQNAARELNHIIVSTLIKHKVPAIPIQTSACTEASNGEIKEMHMELIDEFLTLGLMPVVYGDVVFDEIKGCTIVSTEMIFKYLTIKLKPSKIIVGTDVDGVFTQDPKQGKSTLIKEITHTNFNSVMKTLKKTEPKVSDVTGGMAHKVQELYNLSKLNINVEIINLMKENYLKRAILGESGLGTIIRAMKKLS